MLVEKEGAERTPPRTGRAGREKGGGKGEGKGERQTDRLTRVGLRWEPRGREVGGLGAGSGGVVVSG